VGVYSFDGFDKLTASELRTRKPIICYSLIMKAVKVKQTTQEISVRPIRLTLRVVRKVEPRAENESFDSAQDRQDNIFRKMTADRKIEVASELWKLGKALDGNKIDFRNGAHRPKTSFNKSRRSS